MSFTTLLNITLMSAVLALGQWAIFRIMSRHINYMPLFGSLLASSVIIILIKGMIR